MAAESFYFTIALNQDEKRKIKDSITLNERKKWSNDLIFENTLLINDIDNEDGSYWHVKTCFCNFFDSCNILYDLCLKINIIKPSFEFEVVGKESAFQFTSEMDFLQYIYASVKSYKDNFNKEYGKLLVLPGHEFYRFRQNNKKNFINH